MAVANQATVTTGVIATGTTRGVIAIVITSGVIVIVTAIGSAIGNQKLYVFVGKLFLMRQDFVEIFIF